MSERKQKIVKEVKEITERVEIALSDYRTRYYKEIPVKSRKNICNYLEKAIAETEVLVFYSGTGEYLFFENLMEIKNKYNTTNIYNYLENAVNETLKYYNEEFADLILKVINSLTRKLMNFGYKIENEFEYLSNRLKISNCIQLCYGKYPDLIELQDIISIISDIDSIKPGTKTPEIHELYGVKTLLLEFEEKIKIIETIENSSCINVILEYIDSMIDWNWFKEIR